MIKKKMKNDVPDDDDVSTRINDVIDDDDVSFKIDNFTYQ